MNQIMDEMLVCNLKYRVYNNLAGKWERNFFS